MKKLLVIVDMQNDFVDGALANKDAKKIIKKIKKYAEDFDGDIIFTRDTHTKKYMETQEGANLPVPHCIRGTEGWMIVEELRDIPGIYYINKPTFGSTDLARIIRRSYADADVYFCGTCTGICVISNAMVAKAFAPEAKIHILSKLCACVTPESHQTALDAMKMCQMDII